MENNLNGMGSTNPNPQAQPDPMPVDPMSAVESSNLQSQNTTGVPPSIPIEETPMPIETPSSSQSAPVTPEVQAIPASTIGSSTTPMGSGSNTPTNTPPYFEAQQPMAPRKSRALLFTLIGLGVFLLFLILSTTAIVLAAYGKFDLPDKKMQEQLSYFVQNIPFMPKTPKYILLKSAQVHQSIGSAYTKISFSAKSPEFTQVPGFGDTLDFLIEGPVDASDTENPKLSWNMKLTKELDLDLKVIDENLYFRMNKIPAMIYPFIGLTSSNFTDNPITNRWVYYDLKTLDTEAATILDERSEDMTMDQITEDKLLLIGEKLSDKMVMSSDLIDGVEVNKITLKLTNAELSALEPEIMELLNMDQRVDSVYTSGENPFSMINNVEITVYIEKSTYYMRRFDAIVDLVETQAGEYSQVLGITTIANEGSETNKVSFAMSASLSKLGEKFEADFIAPTGAISFEQFILDVTDFFTNQSNAATQAPAEGFSNDYDEDLSGFDDVQMYAPSTGTQNAPLDGFGP